MREQAELKSLLPDDATVQVYADAMAQVVKTGTAVIHSRWTSYETLMATPVEAPISHAELEKLICQQMDAVPIETLRQAAHAQQIDAHNAEIDRKRAERKRLRQVAKQARIPTAVLKSVLAGAKK